MQFNQGASVYTIDGKSIGQISSIVIRPKTKQVTHIVVHKGLWGREKMVPISFVSTGKEEKITLRVNHTHVQDLPNFDDAYPAMSALPESDTLQQAQEGAAILGDPNERAHLSEADAPTYSGEIQINVAKETVAVKEGASVVTRDDKRIGTIVQVFTDPESNRVTHFLIAKRGLATGRKLVSIDWVDSIGEDEVQLAVHACSVDELPDYQGN